MKVTYGFLRDASWESGATSKSIVSGPRKSIGRREVVPPVLVYA